VIKPTINPPKSILESIGEIVSLANTNEVGNANEAGEKQAG